MGRYKLILKGILIGLAYWLVVDALTFVGLSMIPDPPERIKLTDYAISILDGELVAEDH